jgi:sugar lactone lactonase YvrE
MVTIGGGNSGPLLYPFGIALDRAGNIYVTATDGIPGILVYAAGASGNATPMTRIFSFENGPYSPTDIALDGAGNMYIADPGDRSIKVFTAGASGAAIPKAVIAGSNTGLLPWGIALDAAGNIYVANIGSDPNTGLTGNKITVFAAGASGNATPTATIAGGNTGLDEPVGIAVDGAGNIYVANQRGGITVYAAGASGDVTPMPTITGPNTGLNNPVRLTF